MKNRCFIFLFLLVPFLGQGQGFELLFGDTNVYNHPIKVIELPNEHAYLALYQFFTGQFGSPFHFRITKVDSIGNILWEKQHNFPIEEQFGNLNYAALPTGFMLVNTVNPNFLDYRVEFKEFDFEGELTNEAYYQTPSSIDLEKIMLLPDHSVVCLLRDGLNSSTQLIKVSPEGDMLWTKTYADTIINASMCMALESTPNGDIIALGQVYNPLTINAITKFDQAGNLLWQTVLPIDLTDESYITPSSAGDAYLLYGEGNTFNTTFIAKVDNDGVLKWSQDFSAHVSTFHWQNGSYVIPGENNTFYITGNFIDGNIVRICLMQVGDDGNLIWEKRHGGELGTSYAQQLLRDNDGGFLIAAQFFHSQSSSTDPYMLKTNSDGELVWSWTTFRNYFDYQHIDAMLTSGANYLVVGSYTIASGQGAQNYLIKLDSNGVVYANVIAGQLIYDENQSCSYDNGEPSLANWKVKGDSYQTTYATTLADGSFWLPTNGDSVVVTALPPNNCWTTCPDPVYALFSMPFDTATVELMAQATKDCPVLEVDVSTPFLRRCFSNTYYLTCTNTGTVAAQNLQLTVLLDSFFIFQNASLPVAAQNGNELIFNIGNLGVLESIQFTIQVEVSCDAEIGQIHCISLTAAADNECINGDTREFASSIECQPNVGSYDPNDKRAFSEGALTERFILADSIIEYQIRFQNTGTDTAFNVVVIDTLSSLLDIESIHAGASSHAYHMELERDNILKFVLEDIMLPDSNVNEPASHGFVKFRIRHMPVLVAGDVIPNKAAIFFDFNEAVITNNLELEIEAPSSLKPEKALSGLLKIYPQPAGDWVMFEIAGNRECNDCHLEILTTLGQTLYNQPVKEGANAVSNLPKGHHFYRLWENGAMTETGKLIIIK